MKLGWYNENRERSYPFVPSELTDLPTQVIVDFGCVFGLDAQVTDSDIVYLSSIYLNSAGDELRFDFHSTAAGLGEQPLRFYRAVDAGQYVTEFDSVSANPDCTESDFSWEGFLVTGDLTPLLELIDPDELLEFGEDWQIEPALQQNLAKSRVRSVSVANAERTRVPAADGCREECLPFETADMYLVEQCLIGSLRFAPGYNAAIRQNATGLVFSAAVGAGLGEPCAELVAGSEEEDITGLLTGGPACNDVLRSFNGSGGRLFTIKDGIGSHITPDRDSNRLLISVDMNGLAVCYDTESDSNTYSDLEDSSDSCACGPEE